jgi:hypothetical protein
VVGLRWWVGLVVGGASVVVVVRGWVVVGGIDLVVGAGTVVAIVVAVVVGGGLDQLVLHV